MSRFAFGRNWKGFVATALNEDRQRIAKAHLLEFLRLPDLAGRSFLDIGCGSGIHSLAALQAGAKVFSFDYDQDSVDAARMMWESVGKPGDWHIERGDVLDESYVRSLGRFDVVYSWGVLHHTGQMWRAVRTAAIPLKPDGLYYIALYSKEAYPDWQRWLDIKRAYNRAGPARRVLMECGQASRTAIDDLIHLRNPLRTIREYKRSRGMAYWTDIRDWLGGWPMEFAGDEETVSFCEGIGLELVHMMIGEGNTEYLFTRKDS
jgi:2-polyprenyl-6-hydroxyphenyl methylase/3-demethylubiquinone-9 3-methyltransferase